MIQTIQNDVLVIRISDHGAELQNIVRKSTGVEYLWQGDPAHWSRRSPILFPIVGALKDGLYTFENQAYKLGQHGFARDMQFKLKNASDGSLSYELSSSKETIATYPFDFALSVGYQLTNNKLTIQYEVRNTGTKSLPFSIGAHPAFNCPLHPDEQRSDYQLVFAKKETQERQLLGGGTRTGETAQMLKNESVLPISDQLFDQDAIILQALKSNSISLQKGDQPILTMHFEGFPYFGIWSKSAESPFVCLEPWYGIADHADHDQQLLNKEGIILLQPDEAFRCAYSIVFH